MATYQEIYDLRSDSALRNKIAVAVTKKAQSILDEQTPTTAAVDWAISAIENPLSKAQSMMNYVLAKNSDLTVSQINNASDNAIQSNVDAAVDTIISGGA